MEHIHILVISCLKQAVSFFYEYAFSLHFNDAYDNELLLLINNFRFLFCTLNHWLLSILLYTDKQNAVLC
jgi:hypothetical protein